MALVGLHSFFCFNKIFGHCVCFKAPGSKSSHCQLKSGLEKTHVHIKTSVKANDYTVAVARVPCPA